MWALRMRMLMLKETIAEQEVVPYPGGRAEKHPACLSSPAQRQWEH